MNFLQKAYHRDLEKVYGRFEGVILDSVIGDIPDLQIYLSELKTQITPNTKVLISYHNHLWEPILTFATHLGLRRKVGIQNWLNQNDVENILNLAGFDVISRQRRFFGITQVTVAAPKRNITKVSKNYSVSIVIPARNEAGNISKIIPSIPKFGKWQEIIFVEGNSNDGTWTEIVKLTNKKQSPLLKIRKEKQMGIGKADAVRIGFNKAEGDILMIYDADRTVDAKDLTKFYDALVLGIGDFANGSRLVYPMETQAMQTLNKIGNHLFGIIFSKIFGQRFKDTLCGTKAIFKKDYDKYIKDYKRFLKIDPFGDFALIFTAIKNNLRVVEIPVRYKEREYGSTNINRFKHGLMLIRMVLLAYKEFKL